VPAVEAVAGRRVRPVIPLRDANPTRRAPVVTIALVAACVVAFAYELWTQSTGGDAALDQLFTTYGLVPATVVSSVKAGGAGALLGDGAVPILTSMFLHGGWIHLIGNMLYLWIFGNNIEDRFGRIGFLLFYLFGGAMAAITQVWIDPTTTVPIIGASGAIAAARTWSSIHAPASCRSSISASSTSCSRCRP
jgi:membrane associated rhomboid family serine protease